MTCPDVRPLLPLLACDDLPADEAAALRDHLAGCAGCREALAGLVHTRAALDAVPVPAVRVDVGRLYAEAADRQAMQTRRWRRTALAAAALAAGLLLVFGLKLEVRSGAGQLVIAWGGHIEEIRNPKSEIRNAEPSTPGASDTIPASVEERLRLLHDLSHALAADVDRLERRQHQDATSLHARLDAFQRIAIQKWLDAERSVSALYVAHFKPSDGGAKP